MPYIVREDGEHFVIPSYRDVLTVKQMSALKKDILSLSQSYGDYITLQRKNANQYEVAFSPDTGYLLGESIWHHFRRPLDMIYCEMIPGTTEAILVIVKTGSVYLDGRFHVESIPEELIIFLTQQNNFEIYVYGDVPISQTPDDGKFSFEPTSVKSFTVLDKPVFPTLPLLKIYQLQLVEPVLKQNNIGVFPTKQIVLVVVFLGLLWMSYTYYEAQQEVVPESTVEEVNPYQQYNAMLQSPDPAVELTLLANKLTVFYTLPGWEVSSIAYGKSTITASVKSLGGSMHGLMSWADSHDMQMNIKQEGVTLKLELDPESRDVPKTIYPIKNVIASIVDQLAGVLPGNVIKLGDFAKKGVYVDVLVTINFTDITPLTFSMIGQQLVGLPLVLQSTTFNMKDGIINGSITLDALGS